jgi:hypothetical protein
MLGGELSFHLLNVLLLTLLIAPLVLWRYRSAVLAGMQGRDSGTLPVAAARASKPPTGHAAQGAGIALQWERRMRRRVFAAVLGSTLVASLPMSALYLYLGGQPMTPAHLYLKAGVLGSAAVPIFAVLMAIPFWRALRLWLATLCMLAAVGVLLSMAQRPFYGKAPSLDQAMNFVVFFQFAALTLWLPTLLGLATGARRVRGVAPITFAGLLVFGLAPLLGIRLTQWLTGTQSGAAWVLSGPGLHTGFILLSLPAGLLAWWRLKTLARRYEAKGFSDAQLLASTWWLLIVASDAVERISAYPGMGPLLQVLVVAVLSYAMFPPLLARTLRRAQGGVTRPAPRTLLLLRVFGDTTRTEALFDRIASRWRLFGPVTMIAAPDVVARTVDPGDFLRFASGELGASFVNTQQDLSRRLATLDRQPDPDARYRVNEFCCRDNTWQATVVQLIERADAVVMDLRGFNAQRLGCEFELGELATRLRGEQVVLVVDASTDRALLDARFAAGKPGLRIVEVRRGNIKQTDAVFEALLDAAH